MPEEKLYGEYLAELRGLEEFRAAYQARHPTLPLEPEEPAVRRIVEAIAYFSTRTRLAAQEALSSATRRLFEGYFDTLLTPTPARAVLRAAASERLADPRVVARGTEIQLTSEGGASATFRTQRELRTFPMLLDRTRVFLRPEGGYRLVLQFQAAYRRRESVGVVSLHVSYLEDHLTSLHLLHQLRIHLDRTSIVYDSAVDETSTGELCSTSFGPTADEERVAGQTGASLESLRSFFQFPEQELFLHVNVPDRKPERGWTTFAICFDLSSRWKEAKRSPAELFHLFCVPIVNLQPEAAQPIIADGLHTQHPILHPDPRRRFQLHSVSGTYEVSKRGRTALRRAGLPAQSAGVAHYEVEKGEEIGTGRAAPRLLVHLPEAFQDPRTLAVEALWHQPWFEEHATGRLDITLPGQHFEGLQFRLLGDVVRWQESPLKDAASALTNLLAMKMKPDLSLEETMALFRILCPLKESPYTELAGRILALSSQSVPTGGREDAGVRRRYRIALSRFEPEEEGLMWSFLVHLRALLDAWSAEGPVEFDVDPGAARPSARFTKEFTP